MKEKNLPGSVMIPIGVSLLAAIIIAALLLIAFSGIAYATEDPDSFIKPLSLTALALSAMVCGIVSARSCDGEILPPLLSSVISGAALALVIFLLSVIPASSGAEYGEGTKALMYLGVMVISALGGVIGKPRGKRRAKYSRRIRRR